MKRFFEKSVKLRIMSDLHLEYLRPAQVKNLINSIKQTDRTTECLALLGDIGHPVNNNYKYFIREMSYLFSNVFVLAGNHEYYHSNKTIDQMNEYINNLLNPLPNVMFMEQQSFELQITSQPQKYKILGTTLWSYIPKQIEKYVSKGADFRNIINFNTKKYNENYQTSVQWLKKELNEYQENTNYIVLTHHAPTFHKTSKQEWQYKTDGSLKNSAYIFASNLDHLFNPSLAVWAFGHTHWKTDYQHGNTRIISNPHGYPSRFNDQIGGKFNPLLSIPLD